MAESLNVEMDLEDQDMENADDPALPFHEGPTLSKDDANRVLSELNIWRPKDDSVSCAPSATDYGEHGQEDRRRKAAAEAVNHFATNLLVPFFCATPEQLPKLETVVGINPFAFKHPDVDLWAGVENFENALKYWIGKPTKFNFENHHKSVKSPDAAAALRKISGSKRMTPKETRTTGASTPGARSNKVRDIVIKRDGNQCVITRTAHPQVCHIIGASCLQVGEDNDKKREQLINAVAVFAGHEIAIQAKNYLQSLMDAEQQSLASNLISLAPDIHALWGRGEIAFKPLPRLPHWPKTTMYVQFFWIQEYDNKRLTWPFPPSSRGLEDSSGGDNGEGTRARPKRILLPGPDTDPRLKSGDIIAIKTSDLEKFPLPNEAALWMAWHLVRPLSMLLKAQGPDCELDGPPDDDASAVPALDLDDLDTLLLAENEKRRQERVMAQGQRSPRRSPQTLAQEDSLSPLIHGESSRSDSPPTTASSPSISSEPPSPRGKTFSEASAVSRDAEASNGQGNVDAHVATHLQELQS